MESLLFFPISLILMSMAFGLLGAPFAALICAIISRVRGLGNSYAGTGAWYSMLFVLPWLYLVLRMLGVHVSNGAAQLGYAMLYGAWLYGAIGSTAAGLGSLIFPGDEVRIGDAVLMISGGLFIGCVWFVSIRRLLRRNEIDGILNE